LLLVTNWGKGTEAARSLGPVEFSSLLEWLESEGLEPSDLVRSKEALERYRNQPSGGIDLGRLENLLKSGAGMSFQVEQWLNNGLWVMGRTDEGYPERLSLVLKRHAPAVIYGCGSIELLSQSGIAVVGSRDVDEERGYLAERLSAAAAEQNLSIVSGGARGVDQISMHAALSSGGSTVGVLAGDLARAAVGSFIREPIEGGKAALISPYRPDAGFSVGNAMGRNRLIYALADAAVVVSSSAGKGGTWAGAIENLEKWHVPMYVVDHPDLPGNAQLIKKGGLPLPSSALNNPRELIPASFRRGEHSEVENSSDAQIQLPLFGPKLKDEK